MYDKPVAIIDIGSNSVRLVVYGGSPRVPFTLFNEKVLAGLGEGLVRDGELTQRSQERALAALRRFRLLTRQMDVGEERVVATAAVRDAANGAAFLDEVEVEVQVAPDGVEGVVDADEARMLEDCVRHDGDRPTPERPRPRRFDPVDALGVGLRAGQGRPRRWRAPRPPSDRARPGGGEHAWLDLPEARPGHTRSPDDRGADGAGSAPTDR